MDIYSEEEARRDEDALGDATKDEGIPRFPRAQTGSSTRVSQQDPVFDDALSSVASISADDLPVSLFDAEETNVVSMEKLFESIQMEINQLNLLYDIADENANRNSDSEVSALAVDQREKVNDDEINGHFLRENPDISSERVINSRESVEPSSENYYDRVKVSFNIPSIQAPPCTSDSQSSFTIMSTSTNAHYGNYGKDVKGSEGKGGETKRVQDDLEQMKEPASQTQNHRLGDSPRPASVLRPSRDVLLPDGEKKRKKSRRKRRNWANFHQNITNSNCGDFDSSESSCCCHPKSDVDCGCGETSRRGCDAGAARGRYDYDWTLERGGGGGGERRIAAEERLRELRLRRQRDREAERRNKQIFEEERRRIREGRKERNSFDGEGEVIISREEGRTGKDNSRGGRGKDDQNGKKRKDHPDGRSRKDETKENDGDVEAQLDAFRAEIEDLRQRKAKYDEMLRSCGMEAEATFARLKVGVDEVLDHLEKKLDGMLTQGRAVEEHDERGGGKRLEKGRKEDDDNYVMKQNRETAEGRGRSIEQRDSPRRSKVREEREVPRPVTMMAWEDRSAPNDAGIQMVDGAGNVEESTEESAEGMDRQTTEDEAVVDRYSEGENDNEKCDKAKCENHQWRRKERERWREEREGGGEGAAGEGLVTAAGRGKRGDRRSAETCATCDLVVVGSPSKMAARPSLASSAPRGERRRQSWNEREFAMTSTPRKGANANANRRVSVASKVDSGIMEQMGAGRRPTEKNTSPNDSTVGTPSSEMFLPAPPPPSITSSEFTIVDSLEGDSLEESTADGVWNALFDKIKGNVKRRGGEAEGNEEEEESWVKE